MINLDIGVNEDNFLCNFIDYKKLEHEAEFKINSDFYRIKHWSGSKSIRIFKVNDAGKRGKTVQGLTIYYDDNRQENNYFDFFCTHVDFIWLWKQTEKHNNHFKWSTFNEETDRQTIEVSITNYKSFNILPHSDLLTQAIKPLKDMPKKWNISHVIKCLVNNQYYDLQNTGEYTDDYAYDMKVNYNKGHLTPEKKRALLKDLIEDRSDGWYVLEKDDGYIKIKCYHFRGYQFKPKINYIPARFKRKTA